MTPNAAMDTGASLSPPHLVPAIRHRQGSKRMPFAPTGPQMHSPAQRIGRAALALCATPDPLQDGGHARAPLFAPRPISMTQSRRATLNDIPRLMEIRFAVQENRLSDPGSVTPDDCAAFIARGSVWVSERHGRVVGFSASDTRDGTIWALFIDPPDQGRGLATGLLDLACTDLRQHGFATARLSTDPGTRAERFYLRHGWTALGLAPDGEMQFERAL